MARLIAPARTFGYKADEQKSARHGADPRRVQRSAIILTARGPENGPLRFADEYVRHKVLDLIGDLALAGRRIEGHVVAERAGHAMHTALVSAAAQGPLGLGTGPCACGLRTGTGR
jgi:UDP-3-O-[3-hydroxymyristoyl] N-acetylglucosamine deacetylase